MNVLQLVDIDDVKTALKIRGDDEDARLSICIADVTSEAAELCGRTTWDPEDVVEFPPLPDPYVTGFQLERLPIVAVSTVHLSADVPRVHGDDELLVEGTGFFVDTVSGWVSLVSPRYLCAPTNNAIRVAYSTGYESADDIPKIGLLRSVAIDVVGTKWQKRKENLNHLVGSRVGDGEVQGVRFHDWTEQQKELVRGCTDGTTIGVA